MEEDDNREKGEAASRMGRTKDEEYNKKCSGQTRELVSH